jgi:alpha-tubulin suppressor-like RCC1 family protein
MGNNEYGQLGLGFNTRKVNSWGDNDSQLGLGFNSIKNNIYEIAQNFFYQDQGKPQQLQEPHLQQVLLNENVNLLSSGRYYSVAIASDGKIYSWGLNNLGQLGIGSDRGQVIVDNIEDFSTPIRVFIPKSV